MSKCAGALVVTSFQEGRKPAISGPHLVVDALGNGFVQFLLFVAVLSPSLCVAAQTAMSASVQNALMGGRWFNDAQRAAQLLGRKVARVTFWITAGEVSRSKWRQQ